MECSLFIFTLQGVFEDDDNIHVVMELCAGGGILDRMKDGTLTEARVAEIIRSVLRFVAQCHAKGIIYRDVKPDNFLFLTAEEKSPIRATDFGLSIRCLACFLLLVFSLCHPLHPSAGAKIALLHGRAAISMANSRLESCV